MPRCRYHKTKFVAKYFNQTHCLSDDDCIKAFNEYVKEKKQIKYAKEQKKLQEAKELQDKEKSLKASLINTRMQVHSYIRERDKGKSCISCGATWRSDFEAGHFLSANSYITLKYNLDNIHGQCLYCNRTKEGNYQEYSLRLPERIGIERYNAIMELAKIDKQFDKIWNVENLKEVRKLLKENKSYIVTK